MKKLYVIGAQVAGVFTRYNWHMPLGMIDRTRYVVYVNTQGEDFPVILVDQSVFDGHGRVPNRSVFLRGTVEKIEKRFCLNRGHCKKHEHKEVYFLKDVTFIDYYAGKREYPAGGLVLELGSKRLELVHGNDVLRPSGLRGAIDDHQLGRLRRLVQARSFVDETLDRYKIILENGEILFSRMPVIRTIEKDDDAVAINGEKRVKRLHIPVTNVHLGLMNTVAACER